MINGDRYIVSSKKKILVLRLLRLCIV